MRKESIDSRIDMSKQFDYSKVPKIHFPLRKDNLYCFEIRRDHPIFSLMRSMVVMDSKEANCYDLIATSDLHRSCHVPRKDRTT